MKKANLLVLSVLIAHSLTAYAGEIKEPKVLLPGSAEMIAGSYKVSKSYPLTKAVHGVDGILQLLQDSRLTKDAYNKQFGTALNDMYMYDEKLLPLFKDNPETKMVLMRSLKTNWKLVKSKDGNSKDILHVACRPNFENKSEDEDRFLIYYDRFCFDGKGWVRYQRVEKGFWEVDAEDFPPLSKFPVGR
jgi:hypothetical protein